MENENENEIKDHKANLLIINGAPRSGKDLFISNVLQLLGRVGFIGDRYSSIDYIKKVALESFAWDGEKDAAGRKLLSDLKDASSAYNDLPADLIHAELARRAVFAKPFTLFCCMREISEIEKMVKRYQNSNVLVSTVYVQRDTAVKEAMALLNTGDQAALSQQAYNYDYVIYNNKSLRDFKEAAWTFVFANNGEALNLSMDVTSQEKREGDETLYANAI